MICAVRLIPKRFHFFFPEGFLFACHDVFLAIEIFYYQKFYSSSFKWKTIRPKLTRLKSFKVKWNVLDGSNTWKLSKDGKGRGAEKNDKVKSCAGFWCSPDISLTWEVSPVLMGGRSLQGSKVNNNNFNLVGFHFKKDQVFQEREEKKGKFLIIFINIVVKQIVTDNGFRYTLVL